MSKRNLTIIKIGGSVITNKGALPARFEEAHAKRLAEEFTKYLQAHPEERVIIVHGAGSFGHPEAKKYSIADTAKKEKDVRGIAHTHGASCRLNGMLADVFSDVGCPALTFSPASFVTQKKGRIQSFFHDTIVSSIERGMVPLLHGDVVVDTDCQFSICSGDQVVAYLSRELFPKRVLFVTDVDGIFKTHPKKDTDAELITEITRKELSKMLFETDDTAGADVTDEMRGKVSEILSIEGDVHVLNGLTPGAFLRALEGKHIGTRITG